MPGIASLASAFASRLPDKTRGCFLIELNDDDSPLSAFSFQYFPESVSDSKNVNYQQKEVPGGSLPLYQWVNSGERSVSFTAVFTSDVDVTADDPGDAAKGQALNNRLKAAGQSRRNPDIRAAVAWLRRYMLPTYDAANGITRGPSKLRLSMPGSGIGVAGGVMAGAGALDDTIVCVMTQCEVSYEAFFPSGLPRYVTVQLAFGQIPQLNGQVSFPSRTAEMDLYVTSPGSVSFGYAMFDASAAFKK